MLKLAQFLRTRLDLIVLVSCLFLSYGGWSYGMAMDRTQEELLSDGVHSLSVVMTEEVENIFAFIDGVRGLYMSSDVVTDKELSAYMYATSQNHLSESVLRINYVAKVPNSEIDDEKQIVPGYTHQYIVKNTVDKKGNVYDPSGFNLLTEVSRRKVMDKVLAGHVTGVASVEQIKEVAEYNGKGFVFVVPVYKNNELIGFIDAIVSGDMMNETLAATIDPNWGYIWYLDGEAVFEKELSGDGNKIFETTKILVGDKDSFVVEVSKIKGVNMIWTAVLGGGVLLSFLIYMIVYALNSATLRGQEAGRMMTKDLQKYKLALDSASNHIVITDVDGKILYANKAVSKLTGYMPQELQGQTPKLWGGLMPKDFYVRFWDQIKTQKKIFSGTFKNIRKNGEEYLAVATVSPIMDESGELIGFVGVEEDVTQERKIANENMENLNKLAKFNELMVGRELKMVELKKELAQFKGKNDK